MTRPGGAVDSRGICQSWRRGEAVRRLSRADGCLLGVIRAPAWLAVWNVVPEGASFGRVSVTRSTMDHASRKISVACAACLDRFQALTGHWFLFSASFELT